MLEAPKAGLLEAPNAEVLEAPNAGVLEAPNAGALDDPNVGVLEAPKDAVLDAPNIGELEAPPNAGVGLLDPNVELPKIREDDPNAFVVPNEVVAKDDVEVVEVAGEGLKPNRDVELDAGAGELEP